MDPKENDGNEDGCENELEFVVLSTTLVMMAQYNKTFINTTRRQNYIFVRKKWVRELLTDNPRRFQNMFRMSQLIF